MRRGIIILAFFFCFFAFNNLGAYNLSLQKPGEIIFDDFEAGQLSEWKTSISAGGWEWENGQLVEKKEDVGYSKIFYEENISNNIVVVAKVKIDTWTAEGDCLVGICARGNIQTGASYDAFLWKSTTEFWLGCYSPGAYPKKRADEDFPWAVDKWYYLKLQVKGNEQSAKIWEEGTPEPKKWLVKSTWTQLGSGYPGLVVDSANNKDGQYAFDDFAVYSPDPIECRGVPENYRVELYDEEGSLIAEPVEVDSTTRRAVISVEHVRFPRRGYFEVYDEEENLILKTPIEEIWGGDRYNWVESEPPVCYDVITTPLAISAGEEIIIKAVVNDSGKGDEDIAAAEYFVDTVGPDGTGKSMKAADGAFDHWLENVEATLSRTDTRDLCPGKHTIWVHGQDISGLWGDFDSREFTVEEAGLPEARDVLNRAKLRNTLFYPDTRQKFMVSYSIPQVWPVRIVIYNLAGEKIFTLIDRLDLPAGTYTHPWEGQNADGNRVASGEYLLYININGEERIEKILLIR